MLCPLLLHICIHSQAQGTVPLLACLGDQNPSLDLSAVSVSPVSAVNVVNVVTVPAAGAGEGSTGGSGGLSEGMLIALLAGGLGLVVAAAIVALACCRHRRHRGQQQRIKMAHSNFDYETTELGMGVEPCVSEVMMI